MLQHVYIFFGIIQAYSREKGTGFLSHPLSLGPEEGFEFNVKNISDKRVVKNLNIGKWRRICFWYRTDGIKIMKLLSPKEVFGIEKEVPIEVISLIQKTWFDIDKFYRFG